MEEAPKKTAKREIAETIVEGGLGSIPIAGSALAASFVLAVNVGFNRRWERWLDEVTAALNDLEDRVGEVDVDALADDPAFLDAVAVATRAAQATASQEKLAALRHGLENAALAGAARADERLRFIRIVDEVTPSHLRLLAILHDPVAYYDERSIEKPNLWMGGRAQIVEAAEPAFAEREWSDLLMSDLTRHGLVTGQLHVTQTGGSLWESSTSPMGKRFMAFISPPPDPAA